MEALRERFGKYHVLEKIAQGGMAEVYKVKTVGIAGFEKIQALKRILPSSAREGRFIRSFIDEARIAVELTHRNIVQVFDFGKADGELFLAMELIEGKDLRTAMQEAIARDCPPSIAVAAYVVAEVAQGLDYAHRKTDGYGGSLGIVHCDVSPSNVMLSSDGYVKILDFGIARATFASALERRRLRGKPRYMAPEQTLGEPPTAAADVFALGIIAWELFTGLPLYRGPDLKSILEAVRRTHPPRIDELNRDVPDEIVAAVATALSREPAQRGTAADLAAACARAAMAAGAPQLARWLADVAVRPGRIEPWNQSDVTSVSVGKAPEAQPPSRPSATASLSQDDPVMVRSSGAGPARSSLANVPAPRGELGEGTPAYSLDQPLAEVRAAREPAPLDRDISVTRPSIQAAPEVGASGSHPRYDPRGSIRDRFEPTLDVVADPLPAVTQRWMAQAEPLATEPFPRPSAPHLEPLATEPFQRPSFTTLHRDDTFHGDDPATSLHDRAPENTSYDDLEVEEPVADAQLAGEPIDEPIDDDLGALEVGLPVERRRAVVVAGLLSTSAEAPAERLRPISRSLAELAYQRGGVVLAKSDDELVVAFGLEIVGEDDVAIAMGWALDAAAIVRDTEHDELGAGIVLRVGARAGVATTRDPDAGVRLPPDATDEARALARDASPERPVFVGSAGRLTSSLYELRERPGARAIDGRRIGRRARVLEVVGVRGFDERVQARLERRGKFIGRAAQLGELELWLARAIAANRRLAVLIAGVAGTGKSRLVAELIARRRAAGPLLRVVTTAASPASRLAPFSLVIDLYQAALALPPARGRAARRAVIDRLLHLLGRGGVSLPRARAVATDLERAMELRDGDGIGAPEVADLRPRISAGLAAFRIAMSDRERPLLTVIEDIHLADSASLEVLRHTLAVPAHGPELLVLTARPEGILPAVDATIEIGDLVGGELRALIADRLGEAASPVNIAAVLARGGGNPLFVEELAQAVRDAGPSGEDVPASARDVVMARMERLSPGARAVVRIASVLGDPLRVGLLDELVDTAAAGRGSGEVSLSMRPSGATDDFSAREQELDELVEAGFLIRRDGGDGELEFARGLVREVVYDSLSARTQRDGHARIGRLFASRFFAGREEPPAMIAEHLERGGELAAAAAFWLRAGRLALAASDADAAVACYSRTLALERELGPSPTSPASRARRREALAGREEAHRLRGDLAANPNDLDELQRLCEGEPARLADVAIRRAQRMLRLGDYANASVATVVAEDHAAATTAGGDPRLRGEALRVRAEILERLGRFDEALEVVGVARALFHRARAVHDEMAAMIGRGRIHLLRAHYEAARDAYRPVLALIDKTGDPWLERIVTNHVAVIEMCLGNFTGAMTSVRRSLELCRRYGDRGREGDGMSVGAIILLEIGRYDDAAATFAQALEILARTAQRWSRADCLIYAGMCEIRRGRPEGVAMIDEALAEARRLGARYLEANALVTRAGAHLELARWRHDALAAAVDDAAEGTALARSATLVGYEIQGLARHALALSRSGSRAGDAQALAERAVALLEQQRYLEGSEEEVLAACGEVLAAAGAVDQAARVRAHGRAIAEHKLAYLADPTWQVAYRAIAHVAELLR